MTVLGIPAGVKIHSGVYATTPRGAGRVARRLFEDESIGVQDAEVMDIDEGAVRRGHIAARLHGYLRVPDDRNHVQTAKSGAAPSESEALRSIAVGLVEEMDDGRLYIMGPGTTVGAVMDEMDIPSTLLGVDVVQDKLDHALGLGIDAAVNASEGDAAAQIREITGGGAHVSIEALGIPITVNASLRCLRPLGRHVQVGMPVGHTAHMDVDMSAVYMGNLALYGTRGMPAHRYPSLLGLIVPIVVGLVLGVGGVMGMLAGGLTSGFAVAIFMANAGGAWDNAKKYIEAGNFGGKGSDAHKAGVVGDTVGDPFKDTSGPSLNILIKLMSMVSVVFAGLIVQYALALF